MRSCGRKLEEYAQYVYRMLLNLRDENIEVEHNISILGRSGAKHQIDVYYEFERASVKHRVAIECKNENRAVHKGEVQEFHSKIGSSGFRLISFSN
jgi:Restriction endonuclease